MPNGKKAADHSQIDRPAVNALIVLGRLRTGEVGSVHEIYSLLEDKGWINRVHWTIWEDVVAEMSDDELEAPALSRWGVF